jgi:hypothetical protein
MSQRRLSPVYNLACVVAVVENGRKVMIAAKAKVLLNADRAVGNPTGDACR